jgi:hypothetical protein
VKVLICGSRKWLAQGPIERELRKLPPGTVVVHGAAAGADNIAGYVAKDILGFEVRAYPADWTKYKRGAGPVRNRRMLREEHPDDDGVCLDLVLAFHEDPGLGRGTKDMVALARAATGPTIEVRVFHT